MTLIPVSNENTWTTHGKWLRNSRDRGVRADVDERNEKMQFKIRASQTSKIPTNWSLGTRKWKTEQSTFAATAKKKHTVSVDDFVESILADIANKSRVEK